MSLTDMLMSLAPILLLIGAWYVFMRMSTRAGGPYSKQMELTERQVRALERIADALEKRS